MKILIFTTDVIPISDLPTSGTALRTHGIIQGLKSLGHEVVISVPKSALSGMKKSVNLKKLSSEVRAEIDALKELSFNSANQDFIVSKVKPDAIICGHWPAMGLRTKPGQKLIVDLAGPHLLERHYMKAAEQKDAIIGKLTVIKAADYFIISGEKQKQYFLSFMDRAGVKNAEKRMIKIPMPLSPELPGERKEILNAPSYPNFVFGGVFLPWQDPSESLSLLLKTIEEKKEGQLNLIGGKHPNYPVKSELYKKLFSKLSKSQYVRTKPMLPYSKFVKELSGADVAIDLMKWNIERELAVTIRTTTYLWAGLPVIYNDYADLGKTIAKYDAGWLVDPDKPEALKKVLDEIYSSKEIVLEKSRNARRLAEEVFSWDRSIKPLDQILRSNEQNLNEELDIALDYPDNANIAVSKERGVKQTFQCRIDGLRSVECRMANLKQGEKPISISLYELKNDKPQLLARKFAKSSSLAKNSWLKLEVEPIKRSAGKKFTLEIETTVEGLEQDIRPWLVKGAPYPMLELSHGEKSLKNTALCLRTRCQKDN